jgi:sugar (pentulose or hexulose) kinase
MPLSLADWIVFRLSGYPLPLHPTQAAATGLWSILNGGWHREWISHLGLGALHFPEISTHSIVSTVEIAGKKLRLLPPIGDQQAALGVGLQSGDLSVNVATGSQVSQILDAIPPASSSQFQLRPFFDGKLLATITHLPAGRSLNSWVRTLSQLAIDCGVTEQECWRRLVESAESIQVEGLPQVDLSLFPCATGSEGSVTKLREANLSAAHLFRAALRSMAENYRNASGALPQAHSSKILVSGGLAQKIEILRSDLNHLLKLPIAVSGISEDALNGLLIYATSRLINPTNSNSFT